MRILGFKARNFLSFGDEPQKIDFGSSTTIVGPNDAGKTNIFRAISTIGHLFQEDRPDLRPYYHLGDLDRQIEVDLDIEFSTDEIQALADFLVCSGIATNVNVQKPENGPVWVQLKNEMGGQGRKMYEEMFSRAGLQIKGPWQYGSPPELQLRITVGNREFLIQRGSLLHKPSQNAYLYSLNSFTQVLFERAIAKGGSISFDTSDVFEYVEQELGRPGAGAILFQRYQSAQLEGTLGSRLEYRRLVKFAGDVSAQYVFDLFGLVDLIFRRTVSRIADFRSPKELDLDKIDAGLPGSSLHLDGESLTRSLFQLRNGVSSGDRELFESIRTKFSELTNGADFDLVVRSKRVSLGSVDEIVAAPEKPAPFAIPYADRHLVLRTREEYETRHACSIQIKNRKGHTTPIELAAAGLFELLMVVASLVASHGQTILLDEPALNLHPSVQRRLAELFQESIDVNSNQLVTITHSPYMVRKMDDTWRVDKKEDVSRIRSIGDSFEKIAPAERKGLLMEFGKPELRALLFSRGVVFVEGLSDKFVVEMSDERLSSSGEGANLDSEEWAVISVGGKDHLGLYLSLADTLDVECLTVADYDTLMRCERLFELKNAKVRASTLFVALHNTNKLSAEELSYLSNIQSDQTKSNGNYWYAQSRLEELNQIAKNHGVFVFQKDLEGALQSPTTARTQKPLRAMETVADMISKDTIPTEIRSMISFLREKTRSQAKPS